jgi:aspartate/methionine/tyrosine aminotransferase
VYAPSSYLAWAARRYGKVRYDLATSGMRAPAPEDLGAFSPASLADPASWTDLRESIAAYNDVPVVEAVAALGTTQALWLACAALTERGDGILVEDPGYEPLVRIAESVCADVARFERPLEAGFVLDPDRVARSMTPRTKVVVVTSPHNPSGVRASDDTLRAVARVAADRGAHVVVDEVYAPFDDFVDDRGVFSRSARKLAPNVICASSLGKSYGLGAARVGWLLGPSQVVARAEEVILTTAGALPIAHARLGVRAFERIGILADRARARLGGKRERVAAWAASQGLRWTSPEAGLFGFVHLPGSGDLTDSIERAAVEREVLVAPGAFFGIPEGFRLAWSAPEDMLEEGLSRLGDWITSGPAR